MFDAAKNDDPAPPADLRFLAKPYLRNNKKNNDDVRADVVSYLHSLYESTAEVIPDVRDDTFDDVDGSAIPQSGLVVLDPYEIELKNQVDANESQLPSIVQPPKKKKIRTKRRGVIMNPDRLTSGKDSDSHEIRYLPPSSMKQFWEQYKLTSKLQKPACFPTFWRASSSLINYFFHFKYPNLKAAAKGSFERRTVTKDCPINCPTKTVVQDCVRWSSLLSKARKYIMNL